MEIELFQLENLMHSRTQYLLLDLRVSESPDLPAEVLAAIRPAVRVASGAVENFLQERKIEKAQPVVLMCDDGSASKQLADHLEAAGYSNIYVVAGGVAGLVSAL